MKTEEAVKILQKGELVIIPTETVYGIAALLSQTEAIARIFDLKKRPLTNPLAVLIADLDQLDDLITGFPPGARELIDAHWPGPVSLVFPANTTAVPAIARANLSTVAIRMPDHPLARDIIRKTGPLVATSVNISGEAPATHPSHIAFDLPIVESATPLIGHPSTVLEYRDGKWVTLRFGSPEKGTSPRPQTV